MDCNSKRSKIAAMQLRTARAEFNAFGRITVSARSSFKRGKPKRKQNFSNMMYPGVAAARNNRHEWMWNHARNTPRRQLKQRYLSKCVASAKLQEGRFRFFKNKNERVRYLKAWFHEKQREIDDGHWLMNQGGIKTTQSLANQMGFN